LIVLLCLFCSACPVLAVPIWPITFWLSCSSFYSLAYSPFCPALATDASSPVLAALSSPFCLSSTVLAILSCPRFPAVLSWKSCPGSLVLPELFWLSRFDCPVLAVSCLDVLFWMSCSGCPVLDVLFWLSSFWLSCFLLSYFWLSSLFCSELAVFS
jgi:hypothetical protein